MASSVYLGGSGGGGTPASPDTSIQFNNAGAFGGSSSLEWDSTNLAVAVGHANLLSNVFVGVNALADDNTDPNDAGASYFTLNSSSFFRLVRGRGTLASPTPALPGDPLGTFQYSALASTGDYSSITPAVELQGRVDSNASGNVKAGVYFVSVRGNDDVMHTVFVVGVAESSITSLNGVGDVGSNLSLTAGDGASGFNGGHIIGIAGGSATGTDAGRVEWRGGDSTGTAKGGAIVISGGLSASAAGGVAGLSGGTGATNGGDVNITGGNGAGGGHQGGDIVLLTGAGSGGAANGNLKINGQTGDTTTVTTGSLVGKTMTFTNGILTGFA